MAKPLNDNLKSVRPDRVFKSAVADELAAIKQGAGLQVISGSPGT